MKIIPITRTDVDWPRFLNNSQQAIGRSPTKTLDKYNKKIDGYSGFLGALAEIRTENSDPLIAIREAGPLLQHIYQSFLVVSSFEGVFWIMQHTNLKFTTVETVRKDLMLSIISGNLLEWKNAVIHCCQTNVDHEVREFGTQTLLFFESLGLGLVFSDYQKKQEQDTLILIER